jgi:uncharacterized protein YggE
MPQIPGALSVSISPLEKISNYYLSHKKPLLTAAALIIALLLLKQLFFQPAIITVIGSGKLQVAPAKVEMTVTRVDSSVDPVVAVNQGENNTKVLIDESKVLLVSPDVQRAFYQITPTVVGGDKLYQVVNVFKLTSFEPAKTSELIKSLYTKGAVTISNISFLPAEQEDVTQEARRAALKDARAQGKKIAQAAGKRLGRIVTITDDLSQVSGTVSSKEAGGDFVTSDFLAAAPEKIEVSKVVSVTYEIW